MHGAGAHEGLVHRRGLDGALLRGLGGSREIEESRLGREERGQLAAAPVDLERGAVHERDVEQERDMAVDGRQEGVLGGDGGGLQQLAPHRSDEQRARSRLEARALGVGASQLGRQAQQRQRRVIPLQGVSDQYGQPVLLFDVHGHGCIVARQRSQGRRTRCTPRLGFGFHSERIGDGRSGRPARSVPRGRPSAPTSPPSRAACDRSPARRPPPGRPAPSSRRTARTACLRSGRGPAGARGGRSLPVPAPGRCARH